MKFFAITLLSLFVFAGIAFAEENEAADETSADDEIVEEENGLSPEVRARIEAAKRRAEALRRAAEARQEAGARIANALQPALQRAMSRFSESINMLSLFADKVERHIDTLEERGTTVSEAREALVEARAKIERSARGMNEVALSVENIIAARFPGQRVDESRAALEGTKSDLLDAKRSLLRAVRSMQASLEKTDGGSQ